MTRKVPPSLPEFISTFMADVSPEFDSRFDGFSMKKFTEQCLSEGAVWAASHMATTYISHPEFKEEGPESAVLAICLEIMDAHAIAKTLAESSGSQKQ